MSASEPDRVPRSRRDRPAKAPLSRQGIIQAALAILHDEGPEKVTMRRVAAALDSGHASLYVYVRNTGDLHAQILDALLAEVGPAGAAGTWRDRLKDLLIRYGGVLFKHPGLARMALSTRPSGPHYLRIVESVLALLHEGGVTGRAAAWGVDLLLLYPTAVAAEHSRSAPAEQDEWSALTRQLNNVDGTRYPRIAALGLELLSGDGDRRSDWALDVLIDGIVAAGLAQRSS